MTPSSSSLDSAVTGSRPADLGDDGSPAPADRGRRGPGTRWLLPVTTTVGFLAVWEIVTQLALPAALPPVTSILGWLVEALPTRELWAAVGQTLLQWAFGLLVGAGTGIVLGVAIGGLPLLRRLLQVPLEFLRPIPAVVYIPLIVLLMGATSRAAAILGAVAALWPLLFQTSYGMSSVDPMARDTGRVFGLSAAQRTAYILVPSILPYVATGLRIAASLTLVVVVAVELITGVPGLGDQLWTYALNAVYPGVYAMILVTGVLGVAINRALQRVERSLLKWHVTHRNEVS